MLHVICFYLNCFIFLKILWNVISTITNENPNFSRLRWSWKKFILPTQGYSPRMRLKGRLYVECVF